MTCPDICTAAKCRELEARIGALEQALELLEASFEAHTSQDIPTAHEYTPEFEPFVTFDIFPTGNNSYEFQVSVNGDTDSDTLTLDPDDNVLDVTMGITSQNEIEVSVQLGEQFASDSAPLPRQDVSVDVFELSENEFAVAVQVGESSDEDSFTVPEGDRHVPSQLNVGATYANDVLTIQVNDGESGDVAQVTIDAREINNFGGGEVNCPELDFKLNEVLAAINRVENEVTIDITSTVNTDYKCDTPKDAAGEETSTEVEAKLTPMMISGKGLAGLHENLKTINANLDEIFKASCLKVEPTEVVSIVAADRVIPNTKGKVLVLHFVELDSYPKRLPNSSYWQIQIPGAKESYTWNDDFLDLRFRRGNQYAELRLNEFKNPISGFFESEAAANSYFDAVLGLTTATEKNRVIPKHSNPQTTVATRVTRPYRAFIESINQEGQAVCEIKYVPPVENE